MSLQVGRIETEEALAALEPEWRALERTSANTLPFRTFNWASLWWRHLREQRSAVRDSLAMRTVRSSDGRLVGVIPLMLTQRPGVGPLRTRCLQLIGADPNMTEVRGGLCEAQRESEIYDAVLSDLEQVGPVDWVRLSGLGPAVLATDALARSGLESLPGVSCYVLPLSTTSWEAFRASRPPNLREALRKCEALPRRDGLALAVEVVTAPGEADAALRDFFGLHAARASAEGGAFHRNVFADASCQRFLLDVCGAFAGDGALRILRVTLGGKLAATRIAFALGGSLYLYYSGVDPAFATYRVGTTLVAEAIKLALREGLTAVNLSSGSDESKQRWRPQELAFRELLWVPPHALGRVKYGAYRLVRRALGDGSTKELPWLGQASRTWARRAPVAGTR